MQVKRREEVIKRLKLEQITLQETNSRYEEKVCQKLSCNITMHLKCFYPVIIGSSPISAFTVTYDPWHHFLIVTIVCFIIINLIDVYGHSLTMIFFSQISQLQRDGDQLKSQLRSAQNEVCC